ncbi:MAG: A24 family peptidase [Clostridiales bacterium]|nr:A24 family peptidase [Clostridiales bacterium]MDY2920395.1 A24 family peptidase [Lentihominibacter sp.]
MNGIAALTAASAVCIAVGITAGLSVVYVFNRIPPSWLCDYGEEPSQELKDPHVKRLKENPWRWLCAAGLACLCLRLLPGMGEITLTGIQMTASGLVAVWAMIIIGIADKKYMIIPDQFVLVLVVAAVGMAGIYRNTVSPLGIEGLIQPLAGLLLGGGFMVIIAGAGALTKKEILGWGDVKLCAGMGVFLGAEGIGTVMIAASLASGAAAAAGLIRGKYGKDDSIPLGPYLCTCGALYVFTLWPMTMQMETWI